MMLAQETFNAYNSFILLAVPFFLLTANLMNTGGITDRLMTFSRRWWATSPAGWRRSTWCSRSSSPASAAAARRTPPASPRSSSRRSGKEGYDDSFSVAITAVSAVLAVIIPPSILMIVWGGVLTVSIGALFLAGVVPGLLIGLVQMATVHAYAKARGYPTYPRATLAQVARSFLVSVPALTTPLIIIGGKIFGWFTATESACIAVLYAGFLSLLVYREMDWRGLVGALGDTGRLAGVALFCVGTASAFGWLLAFYQIPEALLSA
jgi:tripartite ATP-independent transporter DctM subunit